MTQRHTIAIEDVLRSETRLAHLAAVFRSLWSVLPNALTLSIAIVALTLAEVGLQLALAFAGKRALDAVMQGQAIGATLVLTSLVLLLAALLTARQRMITMESAALAWREAAVTRLARNIADGSLLELSSVPMAGLREIIMTDAPFLTRFGVETLSQGVVLGTWIVAAFGFLAWYGAPLLVVLCLVLALCLALLGTGAVRHLKLTGERFRRLADLSQSARDVVEVERVLLTRQFGLGSRFIDGFEAAHRDFRRIALRQGRLTAGVRASVSVVNAVAFLGLVVAGGWMINQQSLAPGVLLAALFILGQMLGALLQMGDIAGRLAEAAAAGRRLSVYWHAENASSVPSPPEGDVSPERVRRIEVRSLSFGYTPERRIFEAVDVTLTRGSVTALTAETGAGKSTFARTVCGMLEADEGEVGVEVDGSVRPVTDMPAGSVLYLGAYPIILPGSLTDNLLVSDSASGTDGVGPASVRASEALQAVQSHIQRDGRPLDWQKTLIDASGMGLSSGQAQLVQLCRALVRNPAVVVFDEATSSLDMETERLVQNALIDWCQERICLVVSHRPCPWLDIAHSRINWA